jgi:excinuclease UvrABC nuclease subunit
MKEHSVYVLLAADGTCLYVGCSANVNRRVAEHRKKTWGHLIEAVEVTECPSKGRALTLENELIHDMQPLHNIRKRELHPLIAAHRAWQAAK